VEFLDRLLGRKKTEETWTNSAKLLVSASVTHSLLIADQISAQFPSLNIDRRQWNFVLTVASIFVALSSLTKHSLPSAQEDALIDIVAEDLRRWDPSGMGGFENCKSVFEQEFGRLTAAGHEARFIGSDALGMWIAVSLIRRQPYTQEECQLVRVAGATVIHSFLNWWKS
jgi:hypothetical protein